MLLASNCFSAFLKVSFQYNSYHNDWYDIESSAHYSKCLMLLMSSRVAIYNSTSPAHFRRYRYFSLERYCWSMVALLVLIILMSSVDSIWFVHLYVYILNNQCFIFSCSKEIVVKAHCPAMLLMRT